MDAITNIKLQIIGDFNEYLKNMNLGHIKDYSNILHKISFVQTYSSFENIDSIYEFLINN